MSRSIRLKEFAASQAYFTTPNDTYLTYAPLLDQQRSYFISTDGDGYINTALQHQATTELILLGDSSIENMFADVSQRLAFGIQELLLQANCDVQVKTSAVSGTTTLNLINLILNKIIHKKNAVLCIFLPSNDAHIQEAAHYYWNDHIWFSNLTPQANKQQLNNAPEDLFNHFAKLFDTLCHMLKLYNVPCYFFATLSRNYNACQFRLNSIAEKICESYHYPFVPLQQFCLSNANLFYDDVHLHRDIQLLNQKVFDVVKNEFTAVKRSLNYQAERIDWSNAANSVLFNKAANSNTVILATINATPSAALRQIQLRVNQHFVFPLNNSIWKIKDDYYYCDIELPAGNSAEFSFKLPNFYFNYSAEINFVGLALEKLEWRHYYNAYDYDAAEQALTTWQALPLYIDLMKQCLIQLSASLDALNYCQVKLKRIGQQFVLFYRQNNTDVYLESIQANGLVSQCLTFTDSKLIIEFIDNNTFIIKQGLEYVCALANGDFTLVAQAREWENFHLINV